MYIFDIKNNSKQTVKFIVFSMYIDFANRKEEKRNRYHLIVFTITIYY